MKFNLATGQLKNLVTKQDLVFEGAPATIVNMTLQAILMPMQGDDASKKLAKYRLGIKLSQAEDEVDLTAEEIALIKAACGEAFSPMVYGQIVDFFENPGVQKSLSLVDAAN